MAHSAISHEEFSHLGLSDWRVLQGPIFARYRTGDFATGLALVTAIGEIADDLNHHPEVDLRYAWVQVRSISHDTHSLTQRDVDLATRISAAAAALEITADVSSLTLVEFGLDTWDAAELLPFWRAVYALPEVEGVPEVLDPNAFTATVWFQSTDKHDAPRQRWHPDVWVGADEAEARIAAALAAGGTLVDDAEAPAFTVLADPHGNQVCICTAVGR